MPLFGSGLTTKPANDPTLDELLARLGIGPSAPAQGGGPPPSAPAAVPQGAQPDLISVLQGLGITPNSTMNNGPGAITPQAPPVSVGQLGGPPTQAASPSQSTSMFFGGMGGAPQPPQASADGMVDVPSQAMRSLLASANAGPQGGPSPTPATPPVSAAPPATPGLPSIPSGALYGKRGEVGDALDQVFLGGAIERFRDMQRRRVLADYEVQRNAAVLSRLSPNDQLAYLTNPGELGKAYAEREAPHVLSGGQSLDEGGDAPMRTAPLLGTDNGRNYTQTPGSTTITGYTGPQVGANGVDARTGVQFPVASTVAIPSGSTPFGVVTAGNATPSFPQIGTNGLGSGGPVSFPSASSASPAGVPGGSGSAPITGAGGRMAAPGADSTAPRSVRLNNPGNLKALPNGRTWNGQIGTDPSGYAIFASPADGQAAGLKNVQAYAKRGIGTVARAIGRWAPQADGNNTGRYASFVARHMGVSPQQPIDLSDPATASKFFEGVSLYEGGGRGGSPAAAATTASPSLAPAAGGFRGGSATALAAPRTPTLLAPGDPRLKQFPPGAAVEQAPDGTLNVRSPGFTPEVVDHIRDEVTKDPTYVEYSGAVPLVKAMRSAMGDRSAAGDLSFIEAAARTFNPKATVRQGVMKSFDETNGLPDQIVGALNQLNSGGANARLSPATKAAILRQAEQRLLIMRKSLQPIIDNKADFARRNGLNPADILPPVEEPGALTPTKAEIMAELQRRGALR